MGQTTGISWCDHTFNPWIGCTKISPACDGCYAAHLMDTRLHRVEWGGERKRTSESYWQQPRKWDRAAEKAGVKRLVFCSSLADVFDNQVPAEWRRDLFTLIDQTPNLIWLLLTKRPQNIVALSHEAGELPPNAAIGTTIEDQRRADLNEIALVNAAAEVMPAFTFLSCEPLLEPIRLKHLYPIGEDGVVTTPRIDWVISGGETDQGKHLARPSHPDWYRSLRDQCAAAGVPFHHKQNGEWADAETLPSEIHEHYDVQGLTAEGVVKVGKAKAGRELDGVVHDAMPVAA